MPLVNPIAYSAISETQTGPSLRSPGLAQRLALRDPAPEREASNLAVTTGTRLSSEVKAMAQAFANTRDGASLVQIANQALDEIETNLETMEELADDADSGDYSAQDRAILDTEFAELRDENDSLANETEFNDIKVLLVETSEVVFKVGTDSTDSDDITLTLQSALAEDLASGLESDELISTSGASSAVTNVATAQVQLADIRASFDAVKVGLDSAAERLKLDSHTFEAAKDLQLNNDEAIDLSRLVSDQILKDITPTLLARAVRTMQELLRSPRLATTTTTSSVEPAPTTATQYDEPAPATSS